MTTLAFDGQYVAADKGSWSNGHINMVTKLSVVTIDGEKFIAGTQGSGPFSVQLLRHLCDPSSVPAPDFAGTESVKADDSCVTLVSKYGVIQIVTAAGWYYTLEGVGPRGVFASGGGREVALGALLAGASAQRAVEIAIEHSDYGGHGVTVHSIGEL